MVSWYALVSTVSAGLENGVSNLLSSSVSGSSKDLSINLFTFKRLSCNQYDCLAPEGFTDISEGLETSMSRQIIFKILREVIAGTEIVWNPSGWSPSPRSCRDGGSSCSSSSSGCCCRWWWWFCWSPVTKERVIDQFVIVVGVQVLDIWYSVGQIKNILNGEIFMFQSIRYSQGTVHLPL